jgi:hypothetical protein
LVSLYERINCTHGKKFSVFLAISNVFKGEGIDLRFPS